MKENMPEFDQESLRRMFEEAQRQEDFWAQHYQDFVKQKRYRYKFIAVKNEQIIACSKDLIKLMKKIETKGLKPAQVWVRFITDQPRHLMH